jgi:cysteine desulfuration protein SufE
MAGLPALTDILEEYQLVDAEDRYRLLIDLGRQLEPMPEALKTDTTKVRGCSASVWVYPTATDGRLHFLADSNAAITKGVVALVLATVQDRPAAEVAQADIPALLAPFDLTRELSSNRTQGIPNMIALVHDTARRLAAA